MRLFLTRFFERDYKDLPQAVRDQCDKQLLNLLKNSHHPSLHTSKIHGVESIWEGRISKDYRFTFQIAEDIYILRRAGQHDEVLKRP